MNLVERVLLPCTLNVVSLLGHAAELIAVSCLHAHHEDREASKTAQWVALSVGVVAHVEHLAKLLQDVDLEHRLESRERSLQLSLEINGNAACSILEELCHIHLGLLQLIPRLHETLFHVKALRADRMRWRQMGAYGGQSDRGCAPDRGA